MEKKEFLPDYTVCPGWHIADEAKRQGMTKAEVARRLGVTLPTLHRMVSGKIPLSPMLAQKLQYVLGLPSDFWNALERQYRLDLVRLKEVGEKEEKWVRSQPVKELLAAGLVKGESSGELYRSLMEFYRTGDLKGWDAVWKRRCGSGVKAAYARSVEILLAKSACGGYDRKKLKAVIKEERSGKPDMTLDEYLAKIRKGLAAAGVALALCKSADRKVIGVTKWQSSKKALVGVNPEGLLPHKIVSAIWHETSHVLQQKRLVSYMCGETGGIEEKAEKFAYETTLTSKADREVRTCQEEGELRVLAEKYAVPLFIVAGRYGDLTGNRRRFAKFCKAFKWPKGAWHL